MAKCQGLYLFCIKKNKDKTITARSIDFFIPIAVNVQVFKLRMQRTGETAEKSSVTWTSKYGSVVISSWDIGVPDGMNEKGLMANMLLLNESGYLDFVKNWDKQGFAITLWAQNALENFVAVAEAVEDFRKEQCVVLTDIMHGTKQKPPSTSRFMTPPATKPSLKSSMQNYTSTFRRILTYCPIHPHSTSNCP